MPSVKAFLRKNLQHGSVSTKGVWAIIKRFEGTKFNLEKTVSLSHWYFLMLKGQLLPLKLRYQTLGEVVHVQFLEI